MFTKRTLRSTNSLGDPTWPMRANGFRSQSSPKILVVFCYILVDYMILYWIISSLFIGNCRSHLLYIIYIIHIKYILNILSSYIILCRVTSLTSFELRAVWSSARLPAPPQQARAPKRQVAGAPLHATVARHVENRFTSITRLLRKSYK